jgi:hypothetical protein
MSKWAAMFAAALAVSQLVAGSAQAFEGHSVATSVQAKKENQQTPGGDGTNFPDRPGSLSAGPMADLKVELHSGWWVGDVRHSRFKVSNIGNNVAPNVRISRVANVAKIVPPGGDFEQSFELIGDMPAGAFQLYDVVCTPKNATWRCDLNELIASTVGSDSDMTNNRASDDV